MYKAHSNSDERNVKCNFMAYQLHIYTKLQYVWRGNEIDSAGVQMLRLCFVIKEEPQISQPIYF